MFLVNGFQLRGIITGFDCFVVILDSEGRQQVIYKHAISTIAPLRPVELREDEAAEHSVRRGEQHTRQRKAP
ncbi:MAG: RNA chaperone Hfq [Dysosmobacter sp.]